MVEFVYSIVFIVMLALTAMGVMLPAFVWAAFTIASFILFFANLYIAYHVRKDLYVTEIEDKLYQLDVNWDVFILTTIGILISTGKTLILTGVV